MDSATLSISGLSKDQVFNAQKKYGFNRLAYKKEHPFWDAFNPHCSQTI